MTRVWLRSAALGVVVVAAVAGLTVYFSTEKVPRCLVSGVKTWRPPSDGKTHRYEVVIGSEAIYEDAFAGGLVSARVLPDPRLVDAAQRALPDARVLPIGTSARVGGTSDCEVEAMEGFAILRAAKLAGIPAVEVRAVSNRIDEPDRERWRFDDALAALEAALPRLISALDG